VRVFVFDIDGTVSDNAHRKHHLDCEPKNWTAFFDAQHLDPTHEAVVFLLKALWNAGEEIVFATGRDEKNRDVTANWLREHYIPFAGLYMRPEGDRRDDSIIKVEQLRRIEADGYEVALWFDDRQRVVDALRAVGVKVLQVAEGAF
jgi:predicted secreted acid phosphatase